MPSPTMEAALVALATALDTATTAEVIRNGNRPEDIPAGGFVNVRDGAQTNSEETFSPLRYHIEHTAEVVVLAPTEATRSSLAQTLAAALVADRTLGSAIEYLEVLPASMEEADFDGAAGIPGMLMPVALHYTVLGNPVA